MSLVVGPDAWSRAPGPPGVPAGLPPWCWDAGAAQGTTGLGAPVQAGLLFLPPTARPPQGGAPKAVEDGGPPKVRFLSSVQEKRFEPAQPEAASGQSSSSRLGSWRATTTTEGDPYFYNVRTREARWEPPDGPEPVLPGGPRLGDGVQVFSNSKHRWCDGYIERIATARGASPGGLCITVAFKAPEAQPDEWTKKELYLGHPDLRWLPGEAAGNEGFPEPAAPLATELSPTSPVTGCTLLPRSEPIARDVSFQETALPSNWTEEEQVAYDLIFESAIQEPSVVTALDADRCAAILRRCGLPRRCLKELWQVSNPELRPQLGLEEFRTVCRLVAHCQDLLASGGDAAARLLAAGGGPLRGLLRSHFAATPPPRLAEFRALS